MPMRPRSGRSRVVRQRKSCSNSVALGCLKLNTWQPCGIDSGHHVPDGTVFSRRIHRLKDQKDGVAIGRVVKLLSRLSCATCSSRSFSYCSFDLYTGSTIVGHFLRSTSSPSRTRKSFEFIFIAFLPVVLPLVSYIGSLDGLRRRVRGGVLASASGLGSALASGWASTAGLVLALAPG